MTNIAVVFHDADFDGKLSNDVCRFHLKRLYPNAAIHSYGWDYGRPAPSPGQNLDPLLGDQSKDLWCNYDVIYIVDLSVDELMARPELRDKIVWIDHHKSAIEKWDATPSDSDPEPGCFKGYRIDGVAACRLCWQWFFTMPLMGDAPLSSKEAFINRAVSEPELIRLAGEYDIWDHRDPDAKALQFGLRALSDHSFRLLVEDEFQHAVGVGVSERLIDAVKTGRGIKLYCDKQNDEYSAAFSHTIQFEGVTFCALNIGQRGNSDLVRGGLKPEHQAIFAWRYTGKEVLVSLYHAPGHEDIDLSKIAVKYGGGGHKGACGFRCSLGKLDSILDPK